MPVARPMSWQTGFESLQGTVQPSSQQFSSGDSAIGNTIAGFENLAVTNTPNASVQHSIQQAFSMAYGFPIDTPSGGDQSQQTNFPGEEHATQHCLTSHQPTIFDYDPYMASSHAALAAQEPSRGIFDTANYETLQPVHIATGEASYGFGEDFLEDSFGQAHSYSEYLNPKPEPLLQRRKSKELVGIGLYNDKEPGYMSTLNADSNRVSLGRELKLEETWSPPDPPKEGDDEENYSSDEAEEVEEVPSYNDLAPTGPKTTFYPNFTDLSNQSFFFNEDDQFNGDDQYANYLALEQSMPTEHAKAQPKPMESANFMLF